MGATPQKEHVSIVNYVDVKTPKYVAPDPNPFKFKVLKTEKVGKGTIALVEYEGCTTFKGEKLLLIRCHIDFKYFGKLDPHILGDGHIVCARFEPTEQGWEMARMSAHCL